LTKEPYYSSISFNAHLATSLLVLVGKKKEEETSNSSTPHMGTLSLLMINSLQPHMGTLSIIQETEQPTQHPLLPKQSWREAENQPPQAERSDEPIYPGMLLSGLAPPSS